MTMSFAVKRKMIVRKSPEYDEYGWAEEAERFLADHGANDVEVRVSNGYASVSWPVGLPDDVVEALRSDARANLLMTSGAKEVDLPAPSGRVLFVNLIYHDEMQMITGRVDSNLFSAIAGQTGDLDLAFAALYDPTEVEIFYEIGKDGSLHVTDVMRSVEFWRGAEAELALGADPAPEPEDATEDPGPCPG